jgi:hypothetical protein
MRTRTKKNFSNFPGIDKIYKGINKVINGTHAKTKLSRPMIKRQKTKAIKNKGALEALSKHYIERTRKRSNMNKKRLNNQIASMQNSVKRLRTEKQNQTRKTGQVYPF